jgi:hypothetical protein
MLDGVSPMSTILVFENVLEEILNALVGKFSGNGDFSAVGDGEGCWDSVYVTINPVTTR